jgi:hypothetical protein
VPVFCVLQPTTSKAEIKVRMSLLDQLILQETESLAVFEDP